MADTKVSILITAIDDASRVFRDVLDHSDSMAHKLSAAGDVFQGMGDAVTDFAKPLTKGLATSRDAAIGFESEMAEVAKTTGFSAKQIAEVGRTTKGLSREIPMTVSGLNNIAVAAGQSGIALKDTKGFIKDVSQAATAFYAGGSAKELEQGAEKAALAFGKISNVFGIPINKVSTLAAAINVLGDTSIASEKDILNAMTRTAGLGVQAKLTAKDLAALNASMISLGMAPSVAATATNALLSRLTTAEIQSARFKQGLDLIGVSASEMQRLVQSGGNNAIFALSGALDKLDPVNRAKAIGLMFGAEHSDNVGIFLERIDQYKQMLGSVSNDQSNLNRYNEVFAAQLNTTASQIQILNNSFKELAIEIGTAILPAVRAFVKFLTPIIHKITEFAAKHPNIVRLGAALVGVAAAAGSLLLAMAAASKLMSTFNAGIPILAQLSTRFLGIGHPISKMLNWLAQANQRLLGVGEASDAFKAPKFGDMPTVKKCLPVCICPKICAGFDTKLKALVAKLDLCIPICICPEDCGEGKGKKKRKKKGKNDDMDGAPAGVPTPNTPLPSGNALPAELEDEGRKPVALPTTAIPTELADEARKPQPLALPAKVEEKVPEKQNLTLPQIAKLVVALGATALAVQKLTDSNANLGEKVTSAVTAIGAGLAAKEALKPKKTPQEEATEVATIQEQTAQKVGSTQLEIADKLSAKQLTNAQELAKTTQANQLAELATANQLATIKQQQNAQQLLIAEKLSATELAKAQGLAQVRQASQLTEIATAEKLSATELAKTQGLAQIKQASQAAEIATAEKLSATELAKAQELAKLKQAAQLAEIATADKLAAGKLIAQQASNKLATQQLQTQLAAQKAGAAIELEKTRAVTAQQVAATATQSMMAAATKSHTAVTDVAGAQQIGLQQNLAAQQVGVQQNLAAQQVAATQLKSDADRRQAQEEAAQAAAIAAEEKKQAQIQKAAQAAAEAKAKADAEFVPVEDSEGPTRSELQSQSRSSPERKSGGGFAGKAALLGLGALGIGGAVFAATKAVSAIGSAISGGVGAIGGAVKGAASALSLNAAKGAATLGATASKVVGAAGGAAKGAAGIIGGVAKSGVSAVGGAASGAIGKVGAAIAKTGPIGSAIAKTIGGAASTAGSAIGGAATSAGSAIGGAAAKAGGAISGAVGGGVGALKAGAGVAGGALKAGAGLAGNAAKSAATGALNAAGSAAKSAAGAALSGAGNLAKGAASGLLAKVGGTAGLTKAAVSAAPVASAAAGIAAGSERAQPTNTISPFTRAPAPSEPTPAADLSSKLASGTSSITPFTRKSEPVTPASDLASQSSTAAKNNIVPLVRSSNESGKAIASGLAKGIESSKPQAELAAAGLAQSVSSYLPRSPAEKGPLSDLDQTGFGLTQEFIKGIDGSAIQNKFEDVMNPPSKFAGIDTSSGGGNTSSNAVYSPTYNLSGGVKSEDFIAELEKHDRKFVDWLAQVQERFSRGRY